MSKTIVWYSVQNGGDGSAYPRFFETERIAEMDQDIMIEGWGESCTGRIEVEGEDIKIIYPKVTTEADFIEDLEDKLTSDYYQYYHEEIRKFISELKSNEK